MIYMYSPLSKYIGLTGKLNGWKDAKIQQDFILNFFNKTLEDDSSASVDQVAKKYNEVEQIDQLDDANFPIPPKEKR